MHWRWDVAMRKLDGTDLEREYGASSKTCFPHGLIGQSWDGDKIGVSGAQDEYKYETLATVGNRKYEAMTTKAMAEGAIEGNAEDYAVADRHATNFKYSRFGNMAGDTCAPRDVSKLTGQKFTATGMAQSQVAGTNDADAGVYTEEDKTSVAA